MQTKLHAITSYSDTENLLILADEGHFEWADTFFNDILTEAEIRFLKKVAAEKISHAYIPHPDRVIFVQFLKLEGNEHLRREKTRRAAAKMIATLRHYNVSALTVINRCELNATTQYVEGLTLGNYQFIKYKKDKSTQSSLTDLRIHTDAMSVAQVQELTIICEAVCKARDLVNEPNSYLTAVQMSEEFAEMAKEASFSIEILHKAQIEALKMGGLLAVNKGSVQPPTFSIMEYAPANAVNKKPIILVGKGVVYDTGGLSLKPTSNSMDYMKSDMGGAACVAGTIYAVAKAKLPLHIIALVPSTDNRPGGDAYAPGDVLTMYDGTTVEQMNSDAEGRLILADALAFAKKYEPMLVLDFATLTGAAARAIGQYGIVYMGNADEDIKWQLEESGFASYERLVEFPMWEEYNDLLKSEIADVKSIGGIDAGMITAGKFLERFTDYPWLHFDIAGPAYLHAADSYKPKGGTGVGIRLMFNFLKHLAK